MKFRDLFIRKKNKKNDSSAVPLPLPGCDSTQSLVTPPPQPDGADSVAVSGNELQKTITATASGSTLTLDVSRGEYEGPIVITKPMTIDGRGHSIWSKKGPVVIIKSQGVVLKNLQVEVTGRQEKLSEVESCSLAVQPEAKPTLESVTVRGNVVGLEGEEGAWGYPTAVNMGSLKANVAHTFKLSLLVPVPCRFSCDISGVSVLPGGVSGGNMAELTLKIDPLTVGTRLRGSILIKSGALVRRIAIGANVARADNAAAILGDGKNLWQPAPEPAPLAKNPKTSPKTKKVESEKVEPKKVKKKVTKKKVTKKTATKKSAKKKGNNAGTRVPAKDGKNTKQSGNKKQIPAHLPEEVPKSTIKPDVPDSGKAFEPKDTVANPQSKKINTSNKKSGVPTGGAFDQPPQQKTTPAPTVPPKIKVKPQSKVSPKPRKPSMVKGGFAGGAFSSKPKSSTEPSAKKEVAVKPSAKKEPAKKKAPASKPISKEKESIKKSPVKKKPVKRVQSKGLGSVWGEAKKKE